MTNCLCNSKILNFDLLHITGKERKKKFHTLICHCKVSPTGIVMS